MLVSVCRQYSSHCSVYSVSIVHCTVIVDGQQSQGLPLSYSDNIQLTLNGSNEGIPVLLPRDPAILIAIMVTPLTLSILNYVPEEDEEIAHNLSNKINLIQ